MLQICLILLEIKFNILTGNAKMYMDAYISLDKYKYVDIYFQFYIEFICTYNIHPI